MFNYLNNNTSNSFGGGYGGGCGPCGDDDKIAFLKGLLGGLLIGKILKQLMGGGCNMPCGFGQNQSDSYSFGSGFGDDYGGADMNFNFDF